MSYKKGTEEKRLCKEEELTGGRKSDRDGETTQTLFYTCVKLSKTNNVCK